MELDFFENVMISDGQGLVETQNRKFVVFALPRMS